MTIASRTDPTGMMTTATSDPDELSGTHWPLLGTVIEIRITAKERSNAERAERVVCEEITRLEQLFSVYDDTSMLNRWINDPSPTTCHEFDELLSVALRWQRCSRGAFNVRTRRLWSLWAGAAADGCRPSRGELHELVADMHQAPYRFDGHVLHQTGDCSGVDLNAIAKGFIVDLASEAAWRLCDLDSLTVGAGGDVAHRGPTPIQVGIENPSTLLDDAPSLLTVEVHNSAVATSGSARRGVAIGKEWISRIIDPRTGQPADGSASVTVVAPNATTADVVATILSVMQPEEGLAFVDTLNSSRTRGHPAESFADVPSGPIRCWIVDRDGAVLSR